MKIVAYHRVSTARQGASGLGLEAQSMAACCATVVPLDFLGGYRNFIKPLYPLVEVVGDTGLEPVTR